MTLRERYLRALRCEPTDGLTWAPNLDYWLSISRSEQTVPAEYEGMSRNEIVRAIGGTIWYRASGCLQITDDTVDDLWSTVGPDRVHTLRTPVGEVREVFKPTEGPARSRRHAERFIKHRDDLRVMRYVAEATRFEPDYAPTAQALAETGDEGVVLNTPVCVPFIQFAKTDCGYETAFYMLQDWPDEAEAVIDAWRRAFIQCVEVVAAGPADMISFGDNMDGVTMSPRLFRRYAEPFYHEARAAAAGSGKLLQAHWCGRTRSLLRLTPGCGLDSVEAIVTEPMDAVSLGEALETLDGRVSLQGGIPSVLVCHEGGTDDQFRRYLDEVVAPLAGRRGFVLGMSDNVPPNAAFGRVAGVAEHLGVMQAAN